MNKHAKLFDPTQIKHTDVSTDTINCNTITVSKESEFEKAHLERFKLYTEIIKENKRIRVILTELLTKLSIIWLAFTGLIILFLACGSIKLDSSVAVAFITTSLATVVGLWAISLKYFFNNSVYEKTKQRCLRTDNTKL